MDLATLTDRVASRMGRADTLRCAPRLGLFRGTRPTALRPELYEPVVCLILQGRKEVTLGGVSLDVGPGDALLVSHDTPVQARVTVADPDVPYLSVVLLLDLALVRSLSGEVASTGPAATARAAVVHPADPRLIDAIGRYVALGDDPDERAVMEPMLLREIHYRLLVAPQGAMLRELLRHDSHASHISRAILRIRQEFRAPLAVPDLARETGMSVSSFHKHFREVTSSTPLQYQKDLRLLEARRLLAVGDHPVTNVAFEVGYTSPNQFSREYARKFGVPPSAHLGGLE